MKKFKKLIPALCMLLISAVLMGTSTYAWFSMNKTVTAEGLEVSAKSEQTYLLISSDKTTAPEIQAQKEIKVTYTLQAAESKVAPTAHENLADQTAATTVGNWFYKVADKANSSTATGDTTKTALTEFDGYVIHKTVYLTIAKGSLKQTDLKAMVEITKKTENADTTLSPVKVVIASSTAVTEVGSADANTKQKAKTVFTGEINDETVVQLDILIYVNGEDEAVYTDNFANLAAADIKLSFFVGEGN